MSDKTKIELNKLIAELKESASRSENEIKSLNDQIFQQENKMKEYEKEVFIYITIGRFQNSKNK
jgi:predicted  nucleic acid-binding Zn-ribbon protein